MLRFAYEYLFASLYEWSIRLNGKDYFHCATASLMISLLVFINIGTIVSLITILSDWRFSNTTHPKLATIILMALIVVLNYRYFSYKDRYLRLHERYILKCENRKGNARLVFLTVVGSTSLLILTWILGLGVR